MPQCPDAASALARSRVRPVHCAYTAIIFELTSLRLMSVYWPTPDHYCRSPRESSRGILVRSVSTDYLDLVAHHLEYLRVIGALAASWRVSFMPHLAGASFSTFALEPDDRDAPPEVYAGDLQRLSTDFAARIREIARHRVVAMGTPEAVHGASQELSSREREVLDLLVCGLGVPTIGRRLFISEHTVRNHLKHICRKLGVRSQRELRELFVPPAPK